MSQKEKIKILFQGDSITDALRSRDGDEYRGSGYPTMLAGMLGVRRPGVYSMINRGISGNRVVDLYARWKADCLNLRPDVLSILIGVNDVWHEIDMKNGVDAEKYEMVYDLLLEETRRVLPETKLMILEPFVLKGSNTAEHWDEFSKEVPKRAAAAARVAQKHGALFIPLQETLDRASAGVGTDEWLGDGVHPTAAGHMLIAREWLQAFETIEPELAR